ncbi:hypothetical protein [Streptomyces sp. NPDC102283]
MRAKASYPSIEAYEVTSSIGEPVSFNDVAPRPSDLLHADDERA